MAAVVPQHVPPPYSDFFDPEDVLLHGVQHALKRAQEKYTTHHSEAVNSRGGFFSWIPTLRRSEGDVAAPLDAARVLARSQEHARMLLRCQVDCVEHMLGLPLLQQTIHMSFTKLLAALLAAHPKAFSGTRAGVIVKSGFPVVVSSGVCHGTTEGATFRIRTYQMVPESSVAESSRGKCMYCRDQPRSGISTD